MLGFTVPLAVILAIESTLALLLLGPRATAAPALLLCRATKDSVGHSNLVPQAPRPEATALQRELPPLQDVATASQTAPVFSSLCSQASDTRRGASAKRIQRLSSPFVPSGVMRIRLSSLTQCAT